MHGIDMNKEVGSVQVYFRMGRILCCVMFFELPWVPPSPCLTSFFMHFLHSEYILVCPMHGF
jgi:hypothetical protein